jgi:hypothetical protein
VICQDRPVLAVRALFAVVTTGVAAALLLAGLPLGAVAVVTAAVLGRRAAENGRFRGLLTKHS